MRDRITKEERKRVQLAIAGLEPIGDVIRSIFRGDIERRIAERDEIESDARIEKQLGDLSPDDE